MNAAMDLAKQWLAKAQNDLINADNNFRSEIIPYDTVCFHCQQAAEKILKVYLVAKGTCGRDVSFAELYQRLCECMNKRPNPSLPKCIPYALGLVGDVAGRLTHKKMPFDSHTFKKMTSDFTFSCELGLCRRAVNLLS